MTSALILSIVRGQRFMQSRFFHEDKGLLTRGKICKHIKFGFLHPPFNYLIGKVEIYIGDHPSHSAAASFIPKVFLLLHLIIHQLD
jgi:hypothetical protein